MRGRSSHRAHIAQIAQVVILLTAAACQMPTAPPDPANDPAADALAAALAHGDPARIRRRLTGAPDPDHGNHRPAPLLEAIDAGDIAAALARLEAGDAPNQPDRDGRTAMHAAAFAADPALLRAVLAHGGDPNVRNPKTGGAPLNAAILGLRPGHVAALLAAGADPNLADRNHDAPLHAAARVNAGAIILQLLHAGADPNARNASGANFQEYYFSFPQQILDPRARQQRRRIVAWLNAHHIPLHAAVAAADSAPP